MELTLPSSIQEQLKQSERAVIKAARNDPTAFIPYVLRHEETHQPIMMAPFHREWQTLACHKDRLVVISSVNLGKTQQLSVGRPLWEIGNNPNLRVVVVSNTNDQAKKIVSLAKQYVTESDEYHKVFPEIVRDPNGPWTDNIFQVKRKSKAKDPTFQAIGLFTSIMGARIDRLYIDDPEDFESTRTSYQRQKTYDWIMKTLIGRLTPDARVILVTNAWHPDDFGHRLAKNKRYFTRMYRVQSKATGELLWPEMWPEQRIENFRQEVGPAECDRQLFCEARSDADARFKQEWIDVCLRRGNGISSSVGLVELPQGYRTFTGVDLSTGEGKDVTCLFTILIHPDGSREVLNVKAGRWTGPDVIDRIIEAHEAFHSIVVVESNGAQKFIVQFTKQLSAVPVRAFNTGSNKVNVDFGVESLAVELANGKWIIPNDNGECEPEIREWIQEMLSYSPQGHTGDRLMASWIAREGSRTCGSKIKGRGMHRP
jgi:hypothetical protein